MSAYLSRNSTNKFKGCKFEKLKKRTVIFSFAGGFDSFRHVFYEQHKIPVGASIL